MHGCGWWPLTWRGRRGSADESRLTPPAASVTRRGGAGAARDLGAKPGKGGLRERSSARRGGSDARVGREAGRRVASCTVTGCSRQRRGDAACRVGRDDAACRIRQEVVNAPFGKQ